MFGWLRSFVCRHRWRLWAAYPSANIEIWECVKCPKVDVRKASEVF